MTKREKIIYSLDCCSWGIKCSFCPYKNEPECRTVLMCDTLDLLKEKENGIGIEPKVIKEDDGYVWYYCGKCGYKIEPLYENYCSICGTKIKLKENKND